MYLTLSLEELANNGFPMTTNIGIMVNYTPFSNHMLTYDKIEKCGIFEACPCCHIPCKITSCGKCFKLFHLTLDDEYIYEEKCSYHPGKDIAFDDYRGWTCCGRGYFEPGCIILNQHVWNGVVPGYNGPLKDYVATPYLEILTIVDIGVYAIDCEMCFTWEGLEATQITVVNMNCETVYETYIKPDSEIIDYNSKYSGIFPSTLQGVNKTLSDVQKDLLSFINTSTILVGHGLDNDLRALRISHPTCIDTSLLYEHPKHPWYRHSLRYLAHKHLCRTIQASVHYPDEDARTAMDLAMVQLHFLHLNELVRNSS